jgi:hypothetical protein
MMIEKTQTGRRETLPAGDLIEAEEYEALLLARLRAEYERLRERTASVVDLDTPF